MGLGLAAVAHAQDPAPRSLLERARLTGDWGGLRTALEDRGLDLGLANQGDLFGIVAGGVRRQAVYADLLEPTLAIDLDKLAGWGGARLFVRGIGTYGVDPIEATGSIHAPSSLASSVDTFALIEGWGELSFLGDTVAVLAGLYALDTEFDVKRTAGVFLNGGFGTGLDLSETGRNGPCIFPVSCLGARIAVRPTRELSLKTAVLDGVAGDPDHPHGTRVRLDEEDGLLVAIEIGYERGGVGARFFRAALGAWLYTGEFPDVLAVDDDGEPRVRHGTHGLYGLAEAGLFREAGQRTRGLDAFLRAGMADARVNQIAYSVSGGLVYTGLLPGRGEDITGLAASAGINGDRFRLARRRAGSPADGHEVALEWTYLARLLPWLHVQLDLQYIINPGTDPARDDALAVGLRYRIDF